MRASVQAFLSVVLIDLSAEGLQRKSRLDVLLHRRSALETV